MSLTGDRIRELRQQQHMTLDDVARFVGVGRQAIYKYEQGTVTNIPLENLEKMAVLFGTTPGHLAGWDDDPPDDPPDLPQTPEARILSRGVDRLPPEERQQLLDMARVMFKHVFDKEDDHDPEL